MKLSPKRKYQRKTVLLLAIPVVITYSTTRTHTHTPQSFTKHIPGGQFLNTLGKTLGRVGPVQTTAERAAAATTLVMHYPSRQALTGLPGTSHGKGSKAMSKSNQPKSIEDAGREFVSELLRQFENDRQDVWEIEAGLLYGTQTEMAK